MKPRFSTLIILTLVVAAILTPFALSGVYIPLLRDRNFNALIVLQTDLYKLITGFVVLALVFLNWPSHCVNEGAGGKLQCRVLFCCGAACIFLSVSL